MRPPYRLDECGWVADRWAELLPLPPAEKAMLLAQDDEVQRLRQISDWLSGTPT
jgi:Lon protease-like protein